MLTSAPEVPLPGEEGEPRRCPACGDSRPPRAIGVQGGFPWRGCRRCGCHFVARRPEAEELDALYQEYYDAGNLAIPAFVRRRLTEIVGDFEGYRREGRLLDVGYGAGALLDAATGCGWHCWGTEVSSTVVARGRERGWEVRQGDLLAVDLPPGAFDVVCMVEVLEHLEQPLPYLKRVLELLRPGGLLYVTTPNAQGLNGRALGIRWSVYAAPEHVQLFTRGALRAALQVAGYRTRRILVEGLNVAEIRARGRRKGATAPVDRVQEGYALNERFSSGGARPLIKRSVNRLLTATGMGDTLKAYAERPE